MTSLAASCVGGVAAVVGQAGLDPERAGRSAQLVSTLGPASWRPPLLAERLVCKAL
jgi:hypothetical protein